MLCPKCGTKNGDTNKFCRECGARLEGASTDPASRDELALGQQLFGVWQLFEADELDAALAKGESIVRLNPDSASAHSLVALIYERKSEQEAAAGSTEHSEQYLRQAIKQYERIIDLNPDSSADREKLATLRMRLAGQKPQPPIRSVLDFRGAVKSVPMPMLAAFGAFLLVLVLLIVLVPGSGGKTAVEVTPAQADNESGRLRSTVRASQPPSAPPGELKVYTFPSTSADTAARTPTPPPAPAPQEQAPPKETIKPAKLPPLGPELTIIPEPKKPKEAAPAPAKPAPSKPAVSEPSNPAPAPLGPSGASVLADAIKLHNNGRNQEAIGAAEQAIALYQADMDAGRNADSARRGIDNAKKLIKVWQQSVVIAVEDQ